MPTARLLNRQPQRHQLTLSRHDGVHLPNGLDFHRRATVQRGMRVKAEAMPPGTAEKGVVERLLVAATGFSRQQLARLVRQWRDSGTIRDCPGGNCGRPFTRRYTVQRTSARGRTSTRPSGRCPAWVHGRSCGIRTRSSAMHASHGWRTSPRATPTTCARHIPISPRASKRQEESAGGGQFATRRTGRRSGVQSGVACGSGRERAGCQMPSRIGGGSRVVPVCGMRVGPLTRAWRCAR